MPPDIEQADAPDLTTLVKNLQVTADMIRDDTQQLREENRNLRAVLARLGALETRLVSWHDAISEASREFDERLGAMEADLSRLAKMADEAAPFLDTPVARYLARMRKIKADG